MLAQPAIIPRCGIERSPVVSDAMPMLFLLTKYALTALVVVVVSEVAKRSDKLGALIASLPLITILVMIWLYVEDQGNDKIARHAYYTFWYVLPTLPMFLLMPYLLNRGVAFWPALLIAGATTAATFALVIAAGRYFGVDLAP